MDLQLQPLSPACFVTQQPFAEGNRVASYLVRAKTGEVLRYDLLESAASGFAPEGTVACRWVHVFKPKKANENPERELKLTAENLFITLADPATEVNAENTRLLQFLALMLERKRLLRPKGTTADRSKNLFEHAKTKQIFEIPAGELSPAFFVQVQEQLSILVGPPPEPKKPAEATAAPQNSSQTSA
jgi:hypothetical protein